MGYHLPHAISHVKLLTTRHKWTHPALTPASNAGTWFTYPEGMEGWVYLGDLIAARSGVEATTDLMESPTHTLTATPPRHPDIKKFRRFIGPHILVGSRVTAIASWRLAWNGRTDNRRRRDKCWLHIHLLWYLTIRHSQGEAFCFGAVICFASGDIGRHAPRCHLITISIEISRHVQTSIGIHLITAAA